MSPTLVAALLLLALFFILFAKRKSSLSQKVTLLPSPHGLPFIGNLLQIGVLPHRSLCFLSKKHGPLMLLRLGSIHTVVVSSPSFAQEFMSNHDIVFASRPSLKASRALFYKHIDVGFSPYGECWRRMRKVSMIHLLSQKMVQSFSSVRTEEDMIVAGTDTSFVTLDWSMAELIRNPRVMQKAQEEVRCIANGKDIVKEELLHKMTYLRAVIKEVLRLHPPAPLLLPRESTQDCQIQGYHIPKQTRVIINAWAIGRDKAFWEAPEEFIPERFLGKNVDFMGREFHFIPFGAGRRICPGISFAIAIVEHALANLLLLFDWKLPNGFSFEDIDLDESPGLVSSRKHKLEIVPILAKKAN